jgi:ribosome-associated protein
MASTETRMMVVAAATICDEKKGEDTRILELDPVDSGFTDFFLITSGINDKQTQAIADGIELELKQKFGTYPNSVEGRKLGEWVLMDYVDFVVHIFLVEKRTYYDIERLRKSARHMDLAELKAALTEKTLAARKKSPVKATRTAMKKAAKSAAKSVSVKKSVSGKTTAKKSKKASAKKATKTVAANPTE